MGETIRPLHRPLLTIIVGLALLACADEVGGDQAFEPPARCRSQCELATSCEELPIETFPDMAQTRETWGTPCIDTAQGDPCPDCPLVLLQGECAQGTRFLRRGGGFVSEVRYFDDDGAFVGLATSTDDVDQTCIGQGFWPEPIPCSEPTISEVLCGSWPEGASIILPWADGGPVDAPFSVPG